MVNHQRKRDIGWVAALFLAVLTLSCDEALPPFGDVGTVIKAGVIRARYVLVVDDNSTEITLSVRHLYDETFEGVTNLNGSVTVTLPRLPSVQRTIMFDQANLTTRQKYNTSTKVLRFDPGDSLIFRIRWDFVDDSGDSLKSTVFRYSVDPGCPGRSIAAEEIFSLTARLRLFDEIAEATYGPEQFAVCYVTDWIQGCVNTSIPCLSFPSVRFPFDSTAR